LKYPPDGLVLAASQIAHALRAHEGKITVFIPHYAMSGGPLILADLSTKAINQIASLVTTVLEKHLPRKRREKLLF